MKEYHVKKKIFDQKHIMLPNDAIIISASFDHVSSEEISITFLTGVEAGGINYFEKQMYKKL